MIVGNEWNSENCYSEADNHTKVIKILKKKNTTKVIEILNNHSKVIKISKKKGI